MRHILFTLLLLATASVAEATTYTATTSATCTPIGGKPTGLTGAGLPSNDLANLAAGDILQLNAGVVLTRCMLTASGTTASPITIKSSSAAACPALPDARPTATEFANMGAFAVDAGATSPALEFDNTVHDYLIKCIEFKREASPTTLYYAGSLVAMTYSPYGAGTARVRWASLTLQQYNITFNQVYIHGAVGDHTKGGLQIDGRNVTLKNSVIDDIHATYAEGSAIICTHCQYVRIINNTINGGSVAVFFGGDIGGPIGSDWVYSQPHHIDFVRNDVSHPIKYNPRNGAYTPQQAGTTVSAIDTKAASNTVLHLAGPMVAGLAAGNTNMYVYLSGCNISAMNGYWHTTSSVNGSGCGAGCVITLPNMNSSGFGSYTANSCQVAEPYNVKNLFECKECEDVTIDGNTFAYAWWAGAASGGGAQGAGIVMNQFQDVIGAVGRGDSITSVNCATGGNLTFTANSTTAGYWGSGGRLDISGISLSASPTGWTSGTTNTDTGAYDYSAVGGVSNPTVTLLDVGVTGGCTATLRSKAVSAATNASPIVVTATGHGMSTGDYTCISGVTGNTAANGCWQVTVSDANTLSLTLGLLSTETTGSGTGADKAPHISAGNGAYVSGGTLGPAVWNHQNRGPGHQIQRLRITNNTCKHTSDSCFLFGHSLDGFVQPPSLANRGNNVVLINNVFEDVDYRSSSQSINCGVPNDDGNTDCGGGPNNGRVFGIHQYGIDTWTLLHNLYYPNNDQTINTVGALILFDTIGADATHSPKNITFKYNIVPSQFYGLYSDGPTCNGDGTLLSACLTGTNSLSNNVFVKWTGGGISGCSNWNSATNGYNTNIWASDSNGQLCTGAQVYINWDTTGSGVTNDVRLRSVSTSDYSLVSTSPYIKGGARQLSATPLCNGNAGSYGPHWQRLRAAQGLVPDPNWAASC